MTRAGQVLNIALALAAAACGAVAPAAGSWCTGTECDALPCDETGLGEDCACPSGYEASGRMCLDVDECASGAHGCDARAACLNTGGGYVCACPSGFETVVRACVDIDECASGTHACAPTVICLNTEGGYECACGAGSVGDGTGCNDLNECANGTHDCHVYAACRDTIGGWECACLDGFAGDGRASCALVDACLAGMDDCDANATCSPTFGGYECACTGGFAGNGTTCTDLDECALGTADCHAHATCSNLPGGFDCACHEGYAGDGWSCATVVTLAPGDEPRDVAWAQAIAGVSSQYSEDQWAATAALGPPDTCGCGDLASAWTSTSAEGSDEWIAVTFGEALDAFGVYVHETLGPGAVTGVDVASTTAPADGDWTSVFEAGGMPVEGCPNWLLVPFEATGVASLRLRMDPSAVAGWNEIDAIGLKVAALDECALEVDDCDANASCADTVGGFSCLCDPGFWGNGRVCVPALAEAEQAEPPQDVLWADAALGASSQASDTDGSAARALGPPDTAGCGSAPTAWTPATADAPDEWIALGFSDPPGANPYYGLYVHETLGAGAIAEVQVALSIESDACGEIDWIPVFARTAAIATCPRWALYSFEIEDVEAVRLRLSSETIPDSNQIDAVALKTSP